MSNPPQNPIDTGVQRTTLDQLDIIKTELHKIDKKVENISDKQGDLKIKFERLDSRLDVLLPEFITEPIASRLISTHEKECSRKPVSSTKTHAPKIKPPAPIQFFITPQSVAKIIASLLALGVSAWGALELFV